MKKEHQSRRTYGVDQESHHLFCEGNKKHYKFKIKNNRIPFIKHIYNLFLNSHKKKPLALMGWYKGPCGSHHAQQCKFPDLVKKARKEFVKTTESNSFVTFGNM